MLAINAPVKLPSDEWVAVRFIPALADVESYTSPDGSVVFRDTSGSASAPETRLHKLKSLAIALCPEAKDTLRKACPTISVAMPSRSLILSVSEERSWELAYLLACLATTGSWDDSWTYWATGAVGSDNSLSAYNLQDKLDFA